MAKQMHRSSSLPTLLGIPPSSDRWNLYYGITETRATSLSEDPGHPNSFFNTNSETSLTLFLFGLIDEWKQVESLKVRPRHPDSSWNQGFFRKIHAGEEVYNSIPEKKGLWDRVGIDALGDEIDPSNSILLFEFQIMNKTFFLGHKGMKNLSFLDIEGQRRWTQFDAILILPREKTFIFFEAKLDTDVTQRSKRYEKMDQIIRGLESAFLLTNCEKSPYHDWDFHYVLVCPRILCQYDLTNYKREIERIEEKLVRYNDLLNRRFSESINEECYPSYFGEFIKKVPERTSYLHWDELGDVISRGTSFFNDYFNELSREFPSEKVKNIENKLTKAGITQNDSNKYRIP